MQTLPTPADRMPPQIWFCISAVFHYLGPSFAVLLFPAVGVLGIAWLRIASAALIFAVMKNPVRTFQASSPLARLYMVALGLCLAIMNVSFYLALDRLPISLVAAIEFVGTIALALFGLRSRRNFLALCVAVAGIVLLIDVTWSSDPVGLFWAFLNGGLFVCYIVLGHKISRMGGAGGVQRLGAAMAIAFLFVFPFGLMEAIRIFGSPWLLGAAIGVGICSSVIPYICDQFAMARLPRASYAMLLSLLPAIATLMGIAVLAQVPSLRDCGGIVFVMVGVAIHKPADP